MNRKNRNSIASCLKLPQFITMNVIDGQAGLVRYYSLIFYSLTINNILNIIVLLLLAGITISMVTGNNGIFEKAKFASKKYNESAKNEEDQLGEAVKMADELLSEKSKLPDNAKGVEALNDLYSKNLNICIYPYQKFIITKDINGYVFTLKVYDASNKQIYTTTYDCDIWGVFSTTTKTYEYDGKTYTLVAHGDSSQNNFIGQLKCENDDLCTVLGYSSRDNGSWDTNTTVEMKKIIKYENEFYFQK